jgi:hypothetical protein
MLLTVSTCVDNVNTFHTVSSYVVQLYLWLDTYNEFVVCANILNLHTNCYLHKSKIKIQWLFCLRNNFLLTFQQTLCYCNRNCELVM